MCQILTPKVKIIVLNFFFLVFEYTYKYFCFVLLLRFGQEKMRNTNSVVYNITLIYQVDIYTTILSYHSMLSLNGFIAYKRNPPL